MLYLLRTIGAAQENLISEMGLLVLPWLMHQRLSTACSCHFVGYTMLSLKAFGQPSHLGCQCHLKQQ